MDENYGMLKKGLIILAIPFVLQLLFLAILLKSQIDNTAAGFEEMELVVDFRELEGGGRAQACALRRGDVGIVELALEPELLRDGAPHAGLLPYLEAPRILDG